MSIVKDYFETSFRNNFKFFQAISWVITLENLPEIRAKYFRIQSTISADISTKSYRDLYRNSTRMSQLIRLDFPAFYLGFTTAANFSKVLSSQSSLIIRVISLIIPIQFDQRFCPRIYPPYHPGYRLVMFPLNYSSNLFDTLSRVEKIRQRFLENFYAAWEIHDELEFLKKFHQR